MGKGNVGNSLDGSVYKRAYNAWMHESVCMFKCVCVCVCIRVCTVHTCTHIPCVKFKARMISKFLIHELTHFECQGKLLVCMI